MNSTTLYYNKYLPVAILYFFLNGVFLPIGVLWTSILTPVFLFWLWRYPTIRHLRYFFYLTVPLFFIHLINGIPDFAFYFKSWALFFSVYVFGMAFYQFLENCHSLRRIFKILLLINAVMTAVALVAMFVPVLKPIFWYANTLSLGNFKFLRLQMLVYEPSYYSTLFAPIVFYYLLKGIRGNLPHAWIYFCLVLIPLFLSLSFGVILGVGLSLSLLLIWNSRHIIFRKENIKYFVGGFLLVGGVFAVMAIWFPHNVLFARIANVMAGNDQSFNGRTMDSLKISWEIVRQKSILFGTGFGQSKVLGLPIFKRFYNYSLFTVHTVGIPNAMADLFATLGIVTVGIKLYLEIFFYYKTKVASNYYRMALFIFIFIYQFTGSFFTNIAEYALWILAFKQDLFPEFNKIKPEKVESIVHSESHLVQG